MGNIRTTLQEAVGKGLEREKRENSTEKEVVSGVVKQN
jgi:hypothetical protein